MYIDIGFGKKSANKGYPSLLDGNYSPSFISKLLGSFNPFWLSFSRMNALTTVYEENPVLFSVLNIKANYFSNVRFDVREIKTGKLYKKARLTEEKNIPEIVSKMFELIYNPNPLQSKTELLRTHHISHDLYGNSFLYGTFGSYSKFNIETIETIKNINPEFMKPILTDRYLNIRKETDFIKEWELTMNGTKALLKPSEILHRKDARMSIRTKEDLVLGQSRAIALYRPLSNIKIAYESLNMIGQERGMSTILSSNKDNPQLGSLPMSPKEKKDAQEDLKGYGTLEGQNRFMITKQPVTVTQLDQDIRKLGLQEQTASDAMLICYAYGLSELLFKLRFEGATYVNLGEAERQMYQNTTIPFAMDWAEDMNVWLEPRKFGFEWVASCDHIKVLQENERERAIINRNNSVTMRDLFMGGGCTFDEWRLSLGLDPEAGDWGKKYIWELPQEMIMAISGRNLINSQNDLKNQANDNPDAK